MRTFILETLKNYLYLNENITCDRFEYFYVKEGYSIEYGAANVDEVKFDKILNMIYFYCDEDQFGIPLRNETLYCEFAIKVYKKNLVCQSTFQK